MTVMTATDDRVAVQRESNPAVAVTGGLSIICDRLCPQASARPSTYTAGAAAASGRATPAVKWTKREG